MQKRVVEPQADETRPETEQVAVHTRLTAEQFEKDICSDFKYASDHNKGETWLVLQLVRRAEAFRDKSEAGLREEIERLRRILNGIIETINLLPSITNLSPVKDENYAWMAIRELQSAYQDAARARNGEAGPLLRRQAEQHKSELTKLCAKLAEQGHCCGDAHHELESAMEMVKAIGFEEELIESEHCIEHIWHNRRAEAAEAEAAALREREHKDGK